MNKVKVAVFASGTGSNFQAIMEREDLTFEVALLICDKPLAAVIDKGKRLGVPTVIVDRSQYATKAAYEKVILQKLIEHHIEWILLAGYMRLIGTTILENYHEKIVNIHPSLLPLYPGKDAIGQALKYGATKTGVTIHFVDEGMDTGPVIIQEEVAIFPNDSYETLKERIQLVEHQLYPDTMNRLVLKQEIHPRRNDYEKKSVN